MAHGDIKKAFKNLNDHNHDICLGYFSSRDISLECARYDHDVSIREVNIVELNGNFYEIELKPISIDNHKYIDYAKLRLQGKAKLTPQERKALGI